MRNILKFLYLLTGDRKWVKRWISYTRKKELRVIESLRK